jgi:hypothetical protein
MAAPFSAEGDPTLLKVSSMDAVSCDALNWETSSTKCER